MGSLDGVCLCPTTTLATDVSLCSPSLKSTSPQNTEQQPTTYTLLSYHQLSTGCPVDLCQSLQSPDTQHTTHGEEREEEHSGGGVVRSTSLKSTSPQKRKQDALPPTQERVRRDADDDKISSRQALGSISRNSKVPRERTPAGVVGLVWSRMSTTETKDVLIAGVSAGPVCPTPRLDR